MKTLLLMGLVPAALAAPAFAQAPDPHAGHNMAQPPTAPAVADPHAGHSLPPPQPAKGVADPHAGHAPPAGPAAAPAADPHAGHAMTMPDGTPATAPPTAADLPVGAELAPPPPAEPAADSVYGAAAMVRSRGVLSAEHGGARYSKAMLNLGEARLGSGGGYHWDGEAWYGGDINRLVLKTEGEGARRGGVEDAEVQALYSRAVAPYTDVQAGLRHDLRPGPSRTYATVGFETLFPYWFEAEGALFLSDKGELLGRAEGSYDLRLTQRLVLQPRAELNFAAQDVAERGIGSGLSDAELGLRLRYEVRREFAPYVGVAWSRKFGGTADFARAEGEDASDTRLVVGLRAWF